MKRLVIYSCFLCIAQSLHAQEKRDSSLWNGLGIFRMDSSISAFGNKVKLTHSGPGVNGKIIKSYEYLPATDSGYEFAGVHFSYISLFTGKNNRIRGVSFSVSYNSKFDSAYLSTAKTALEQLTTYFAPQLKTEPIIPFYIKDEQSKSVCSAWKKKKKEFRLSTAESQDNDKECIVLGISIGYSD
ncbi:MAG: hypothetical protein JST86_12140 [Bacteroidetes bacterium]|nr:hypothetical protein [Bacteroidota bacterium]